MRQNGGGQPRITSEQKRAAVVRVRAREPVASVAASLGVSVAEVEDWVRKFEAARVNLTPEPGKDFQDAFKRKYGPDVEAPSMSHLMYPELMQEVDPRLFDRLTAEQIKDLFILQAIAQEKVGYEKHAPKFFLPEDEDPFPETRVRHGDAYITREINRPMLIFGGLLLGAVVMVVGAKMGFILEDATTWVVGAAAVFGLGLVILGGR
jgi:hypothetical protein